MLRGRGLDIAQILGGLALATFALGGAVLSTTDYDKRHGAEHHEAAAKELLAETRLTLAEKACARAQQAANYDPQQRDDWDLCAQFLSAEAAAKTGDAATPQFLLSFGGLAGILITLWFTAIQAAAAVAGNKTTLLIGQNQTRAYVSIRGLRAPDDEPEAFRFQFVNSGQTPARGLAFEYMVLFFRQADRKRADFFRTDSTKSPSQAELPGSGSDQVVGLLHAAHPEVRGLFLQIKDDRPAAFVCVARYRDVFDRHFEYVHRARISLSADSEGRRQELLNVHQIETTERAIEKAEYDQPIDVDRHVLLPAGVTLKKKS